MFIRKNRPRPAFAAPPSTACPACPSLAASPGAGAAGLEGATCAGLGREGVNGAHRGAQPAQLCLAPVPAWALEPSRPRPGQYLGRGSRRVEPAAGPGAQDGPSFHQERPGEAPVLGGRHLQRVHRPDRLPGAREAGRRRGAPSAAATCTVRRHSTVQMAIFPSSGPEPLSTYLSSAEHSALTVSACATSSFSTVLLSASTT